MKRFLIAAGGAAALTAAALGVSFAQSAPATSTPTTGTQTASATVQHRQAILADAAAKLGLTADQLQQALAQARKDLGGGVHPLANVRHEELQVAAKAIGLPDVKSLRSELAGSTLNDVAQKHGVQPSTVATAITNDLDAKIQSLANAGTIKADRVNALDQKIRTKVAALMTHQFPAAKAHS